jgi:hypothetical protein
MTPVSKILPDLVKKYLTLEAAPPPARNEKSALAEAEAIAYIRSTPPDPSEFAYAARYLIQGALPHSNPGKVMNWTRTNGNVTISLATTANDYPYGSIPRLLMFWLTAEVKKTGSRRIQLGKSYYQFLNELGIDSTRGGRNGPYKRVREQAHRLFRCMISVSVIHSPDDEEGSNAIVAKKYRLWGDAKTDDGSGWVELNEDFFHLLQDHPAPLDMRVLRQLKQSPLALDLYAWVTLRAYAVNQKNKPVHIPWKTLRRQFGSDYSRLTDFQQKAVSAFRHILEYHPSLRLEFVHGGITLLPGNELAVPPVEIHHPLPLKRSDFPTAQTVGLQPETTA